MTEEAARAKIKRLHAAISRASRIQSIVRTHNTVTLCRAWPHRHVQIILRLYSSPAEILCGFDLDCCAVGWDGKELLALPRARLAINRAANVVDPTRESPSYAERLRKVRIYA